MNDSGDLMPPAPPSPPTPPTPPDPPVWAGGPVPSAENPAPLAMPVGTASLWSKYWRFLVPAAGLVVIGAAAAGALVLLKPPSTVEKMVPASANLLLVANVDPSVTQKVNLMRALHTFPDLKTDKAITDKIDQAFKDSGLSFTADVQPWLGAEAGFSARVSVQNTTKMPGALYLVSRDDGKAAATLAKLRNGKWGSTYRWSDQTYNGITISVGTPKSAGQQPGAYAIVDHVVVIGSSSAAIDEIIDADQGRTPRLVDSSAYKATMTGLPSDRLGWLYVDGKSLVASVKKGMATTPSVSASSLKSLADLDAFVGIGGVVSANGDGLLADIRIKIDQSKLTSASRQAMASAGRPNTVLRWIPRGSDAFFAFGNLNQTMKSLLDQAGSDPTVSSTTDAVGLTGSNGVLPHLTGDAGIELEVGSRVIPSGAILLGTDNAGSMASFLKNVLTMATQLGVGGSGTAQSSTASLKTTTYRGVVITSYAGLAGGITATAFQPSYAVFDKMGILASNVAEVKAVIDAHLGGSTIAGDPAYQTALAGSLKQPSAVLFVNAGSLVAAVRRLSAESGLSSVDAKTLDSLAPIKSLIVSGSSQADAMLERIFVVIK